MEDGDRQDDLGFRPGRRLTAAYVATQALLAVLASLAAGGAGVLLIVVGFAGTMMDAEGVFDAPAAERDAAIGSLLEAAPALWPSLGLTAVAVALLFALPALVAWARHRARPKAPRDRRLDQPAFLDPLPPGLRDRPVWSSPAATLIESAAILLCGRDIQRALAGRGYRFVLWHEWHHAATGDTGWTFAGNTLGRSVAVVVAAVLAVCVTAVTPLTWAPGALLPLVLVGVAAALFVPFYRWAAGPQAAHGHLKELMADAFAEARSGERGSAVYDAGHGRAASPYLGPDGGVPTPGERLWFLAHRGTDRAFVLCAGLLANWLVLRLVCVVASGPLGLPGLLWMQALDVALALPLILLLVHAARVGAPPRTAVGWLLVAAPAVLLLGIHGPLLLAMLSHMAGAPAAAGVAGRALALLLTPLVPGALVLALLGVLVACRRRRPARRRPAWAGTAGAGQGGMHPPAPRTAWQRRLVRIAGLVGAVQSWCVLLAAGLPLAYAVVATFVAGHIPSAFDLAGQVAVAALVALAVANLMQARRAPAKRRGWTLLGEAVGFALLVAAVAYAVGVIEGVLAEARPGAFGDGAALAERMNAALAEPRADTVAMALRAALPTLGVGAALYGLRWWALKRPLQS